MKQRIRHRLIGLVVAIAATSGAVWALVHFNALKRHRQSQSANYFSDSSNSSSVDLWAQGVEKVKADRGESSGGAAVIPPELQHYSDRHWFLATQVAEVRKNNVATVQDFVDLAAMIKRGELVAVPAATENYILFGVGAKADEGVFSRFEAEHSIGLYSEAQLNDEYQRLDSARANLQTEIASLRNQLGRLKKRDRAKQRELQKEISTREQQLKSLGEDKALLDQFYGRPDSRQKLFSDYESLRTLAKNFDGRSYNIDDASDREAMKLNLLSSIRPEA